MSSLLRTTQLFLDLRRDQGSISPEQYQRWSFTLSLIETAPDSLGDEDRLSLAELIATIASPRRQNETRFVGDLGPLLDQLGRLGISSPSQETEALARNTARFASPVTISPTPLWIEDEVYSEPSINTMLHKYLTSHQWPGDSWFFKKHMRELVASGLFGHTQLTQVCHALLREKSAALARDFLSESGPLLFELGVFGKNHCRLVWEALQTKNDQVKNCALKVIESCLPYFIQTGNIDGPEARIILDILKEPDQGPYSPRGMTVDLLAKYLPIFVKRGWFTQADYKILMRNWHKKAKAQEYIKRDELPVVEMQLSVLVEQGWFTRADYEVLRAGYTPIFAAHLEALIQADYFSQADYDLHVADLPKDPAIHFFTAQFSTLVQYGYDVRAATRRALTPDKDPYYPPHFDIPVINFLITNLEHLFELKERGLFGKREMEIVMFHLRYQGSTEWERTLRFLTTHIGLLIREGLFGKEDFLRILDDTDHYEERTRPKVMEAVRALLPAILNAGLFDERAFKVLEKACLNFFDNTAVDKSFYQVTSNNNSQRENLEFLISIIPTLHQHNPQLGKRAFEIVLKSFAPVKSEGGKRFHLPDYLTGYIPALLKSNLEIFLKHFHLFKTLGYLDQLRFDFLGEWNPAWKTIFAPLAGDPVFRESSHAWKDFFSFLFQHYDKLERDFDFDIRRDFRNVIIYELSQERDKPNANDLMPLLRFLIDPENDWGWQGIRQLSEENAAYRTEKTRQTKTALRQTATALGLSDHPFTLAMQSKLRGKKGNRLLYGWFLDGKPESWATYRREAEKLSPGKELRQIQKKFLNFLEAQGKIDSVPSLARLMVKRSGQISRQLFVIVVSKDAPPEEQEQLVALMKKPFWPLFESSRLYTLLVHATRFLSPNGMDSLRRLLLGLGMRRDADGRQKLVYERYTELVGILDEELLAQWQAGYAVDLKDTLHSLQGERGLKEVKNQVLRQIATHIQNIPPSPTTVTGPSSPGPIENLPQRVKTWRDHFAASGDYAGAFLDEAKELFAFFEMNDARIRNSYGNNFANIRIDLKNFIKALSKGFTAAVNSERFIVTGDLEPLALSGSEPVETCQTLERAWVNKEGQPLHRLLHGQFLVATWEVDGTKTARRLLEITVNPRTGRPHLLVERLYTAGGFARVGEFNEQIYLFASRLGIDRKQVHISDDASFKSAPATLKTGDIIYRDTFTTEGLSFEEMRKMLAAKKKSSGRVGRSLAGIRRVSRTGNVGRTPARTMDRPLHRPSPPSPVASLAGGIAPVIGMATFANSHPLTYGSLALAASPTMLQADGTSLSLVEESDIAPPDKVSSTHHFHPRISMLPNLRIVASRGKLVTTSPYLRGVR